MDNRGRLPLWDFTRTIYVSCHLGLRASSLNQIRIAILLVERWAGHTLTIAEFSDCLLREFLAAYSERVAAPTVNSKRSMLLPLIRCAWDEAITDRPPRKVAKMREEIDPPVALLPAQIERIVAVARTVNGQIAGMAAREWWPAYLLGLWDTAGRRSALLAVSPEDVSLGDRWLRLRGQNQKNRIGQVFVLSDSTAAAIGAIWCPHRERLWPWPFSREHFDECLRRIFWLARIPCGRGYGGLTKRFRKTVLSLVAAARGIETAQRIAGHHSAATTRRHYIDPRLMHEPTPAEILPPLHFSADRQLRLPF